MSEDRQGSDGAPTGEPMPQVIVDVAEAARRLKVTPDAIQPRLHRDTLAGEKVNGQRQVYLPAIALGPSPSSDRQDATAGPTGQGSDRQDANDGADRTRQEVATVDIAPLVEEISRLSRRNEQLAAAAGMRQGRAAHLEEQARHRRGR